MNNALSLLLLESLHYKLTRPGPLTLNDDEREYLTTAIVDALSGAPDPLRLAKSPGGQTREGLGEARMVHRMRAEGQSLQTACLSVGATLNRDGGKSGAVEKNYKRHRGALEASDRFYAALKAGGAPESEDIKRLLGGK